MKSLSSLAGLFAVITCLSFAPGCDHQPATKGHAAGPTPGWTDNYPAALAQAKAEKKLVLLSFSGSDWCAPCQALEKKVLTTARFRDYVKDKFVLTEVDLPQIKVQEPRVKEQNEKLQIEYKIEALPTIVILNSEGRRIGEIGYEDTELDPFMGKLASIAEGAR